MYKNEFDKLLSQNKTFNAYLFYGQSTYLIEHYCDLVANQICSKEDIEKIYFDEYDFKYIYDKLLQSSLFSSNNVIVIKTHKKLPKKDVENFISACNANPDSTIIICGMDDSEFKTMGEWFTPKKNSVSVRFFTPYPSEAIVLIEQEAKKLNIKAEITALQHLYNMHRQDLALACNDLKKLTNIDDVVTPKVIDQQCFGFGNVSIEDFLFDLVSCNLKEKDLNDILDEGVNEVYLINQITSFVQQLFMIASYTRIAGQPNAKEILGFVPPKQVWEKRARLAIGIKLENYLKMLNFLNEVELNLKTKSSLDHNSYVQASLRKFSTLIR